MIKIINKKRPITVRQNSCGFDRACDEAHKRALEVFGIDDYANSDVVDWVRSTDSVKISFLNYECSATMVGSEYKYQFDIWTERCVEEEDEEDEEEAPGHPSFDHSTFKYFAQSLVQ